MPRRLIAAALALLALVSVSTALAQEGPRFEMAVATPDRNDTSHTAVFPKGTKVIYIVWLVDGIQGETTAKCVWWADKAEGVANNTQITVSQSKVAGRSMGAFKYTLQNGWPAGDYHVELSAASAKKTVRFKVEK